MGLKRQKGLMVAIDTTEKKEYDKLKSTLSPITELSEDIVFMPGIPTTLNFRFDNVIDLLQHYDNKIVFNAKVAEDSSEKANQILDMCKRRNLDGLIVHASISEKIMKRL
jgi:orotidine-5'-phosphate decarboxylase